MGRPEPSSEPSPQRPNFLTSKYLEFFARKVLPALATSIARFAATALGAAGKAPGPSILASTKIFDS